MGLTKLQVGLNSKSTRVVSEVELLVQSLTQSLRLGRMKKMILTERELTLIIEELEVDEEIYKQMIREEREKGNEPEPRHIEVLNLLNKLRSVRV
jgi:hypothetical protein